MHVCKTPLCLLGVVVGLCIHVAAATAREETRVEVCGGTTYHWNAPKGAMVSSRAATRGLLNVVVDAVGEYRTHTMLSHGPDRWVTHATRRQPKTQASCGKPFVPDDLRYGFPGAAQVNQAGIFKYLYANEGWANLAYLKYQRSKWYGQQYDSNGEQIADHAWYDVPYSVAVSERDPAAFFYRLHLGGTTKPTHYGLYNLRTVGGQFVGGFLPGGGTACSTLLSFLQAVAPVTPPNGITHHYIWPHNYGHSKTINSASDVYWYLNDLIDRESPWYVSLPFACSRNVQPKDTGAHQVVMCILFDRCDDGNWMNTSYRSDPSVTATTISPDRLGGWSGHPFKGGGVSVWASDGDHLVQWNNGGSTYGCWF